MSRSRRYLLMTTVAVGVVALDWASKPLAVAALGDYVITNPKPALLWALPLALATCITIASLVSRPLISVALGLFAGGWLANMLDRVLFGPVIDFIPLPAGYVGNLADIAMQIGAVVLLWWLGRGLLAKLRTGRFAFAS